MRSRMLALVLPAILLVSSAVHARAAVPEGSFSWLTPMAGWIKFSDRLFYPTDSLKAGPVFGLRLGRNFANGFGIELAGAYSATKEAAGLERDVTYTNASASIMFSPIHWAIGSPYLAAGGGATSRKADGVDGLDYGSFEQAIGLRSWWGEHSGLRLEARNVLSIPHRNWGQAHQADQQYWAGIDFAWGGRPKDSDGDGVADRRDKCPDTPAGATVDATGCPKDSDGDGVWDGIDKCLGTPKGATVDATGCPKDSDGDGVYDGIDQCPDTPKGASVDARGCPMDADGDGVPDGIDKCPNTPAGAKVDASGCPTDADGDGVFDGLDKCPGTPAGEKVDAEGCPIVVTEKETELLDTGMIRLQNVNFETAKADILPESFPVLDEVGAILRKWPQLNIEIGGHCDSRGSVAYNQKLSEARAASVKDYLVKKFPELANTQLTSRGYGELKPIAPNNNALNMAKNRRVEFVVQNKDVLRKEVEKRRTLKK